MKIFNKKLMKRVIKVKNQIYEYSLMLSLLMVSPMLFADETDLLKGSQASVTSNFGPDSTLAHYVYFFELAACVGTFLYKKNILMLVTSPIILIVVTKVLWSVVMPGS